MTTKTYSPRPRDIRRAWYVVDADGVVLGRLATEVAKLLRGKHKPMFAPHMDTGDHVIVINASGVRMTGAKAEQKVYYRHSGYPGGLREQPYSRLLAERPTLVVEKAVRGMLPKTRLGRRMISKLSVYAGPEHPHQAQKPQPLALGAVPVWGGLPVAEPKSTPEPRVEAKPRPRARSAAAGAEPKARSKRPAGRASTKATGSARRGAGTAGRRAGSAAGPKTKAGSGSGTTTAASGRSKTANPSEES
jgi:large subunit ribosomal protein L13